MQENDSFIREDSGQESRRRQHRNQVAPPVYRGIWMLLVAVVLSVLVWIFFGKVTNSIVISGLVFPEKGIVEIHGNVSGTISYLHVKVGDNILEGDLIAVVEQPEILAEIQAEKTAESPNQAKLKQLYEKYQQMAMVYSPYAGRIVELSQANRMVEAGDVLAAVARSSQSTFDAATNQLEIRAYIPATIAQNLKRGMAVQVYPNFSREGQYQSITGLVTQISSYPVTETNIQEDLGRFYSNQYFSADENIIEIRVTLLADQDGNLSWERANGKELGIDIGTLVSMKVILSEKAPWHAWFG